MSGAKIAMTTMQPRMTNPTMAPGLRRSRSHASAQSPLAGPLLERDFAGFELGDAHLLEPDPRVEDAVGEVDEQVDEDDDDGDEEDAALDDGVVARLDRVDQPGADAREGEDRLGEHRAGEQQPDLEADDRRDRQHRVAQDVAAVDRPRRQALGAAPCARSPRSGRRAPTPA